MGFCKAGGIRIAIWRWKESGLCFSCAIGLYERMCAIWYEGSLRCRRDNVEQIELQTPLKMLGNLKVCYTSLLK